MAHRIRREPDADTEPLVIGDAEGGDYAALRYSPEATARGERGVLVIEHRHGEPLRFSRNAVRQHIVPFLESHFWTRRRIRLCSLGDIADIGKVAARTANGWAARDDFPRPLDTTAAGQIWDRRLVEAWIKNHRPRRGRPPNAATSKSRG
jgi:hypothetical protein